MIELFMNFWAKLECQGNFLNVQNFVEQKIQLDTKSIKIISRMAKKKKF